MGFNVLYSCPFDVLVHLSSSICNRVISFPFYPTASRFSFRYTRRIISREPTRNRSKFQPSCRFHIALAAGNDFYTYKPFVQNHYLVYVITLNTLCLLYFRYHCINSFFFLSYYLTPYRICLLSAGLSGFSSLPLYRIRTNLVELFDKI